MLANVMIDHTGLAGPRSAEDRAADRFATARFAIVAALEHIDGFAKPWVQHEELVGQDYPLLDGRVAPTRSIGRLGCFWFFGHLERSFDWSEFTLSNLPVIDVEVVGIEHVVCLLVCGVVEFGIPSQSLVIHSWRLLIVRNH